MKRFILLIAILGVVSIPAMAGFITPEQAREAARNFMAERIHLAPNGTGCEIQDLSTVKGGDTPLIYIINFRDQRGYILVSADDRVKPILGFSYERTFDLEKMHPAIADRIEGYKMQLMSLITQDLPAFPEMTAEWGRYLDPGFQADAVLLTVNPLIQTTWDQGCYYNAYCPYDASAYQTCYHTLTGCGATAMAQMHKYYNYPLHGVGSHSYYDPNYGTQSANFANATYPYSQMPANVTSTNDEVAELMYHCGVAQEMEYGVTGSLSFTSKVDVAFRTFFNYNQAAEWRLMSDYSSSQWTSMLRGELDLSHPLFYFGNSSGGGGHFFICDGYQGTDYFHFNWGWSGQSDGYYYLNNLTPGGSNFNDNQRAIFQCFPPATAPVARFSGTPTSGSAPLTVQFTDLSTGSPTSWNWSFQGGNPSSSTVQNPTNITYSTAGVYNVSLTVGNGTSVDTETKTGYITVSQGFPTYMTLDFEGLADFTTTFDPWTTYDGTGANTYSIKDHTFPGNGTPFAYMAFNLMEVEPPITSPQAHSGNRFGACFSTTDAAAVDKWLISPKMSFGSNPGMAMWVMTFAVEYGLETYQVGVSVTNNNPSGFTIISGNNDLEAPATWTKVGFNLTGLQNTSGYVGIHCTSADKFIFMVDDIEIGESLGTPDIQWTGTVSIYPNPASDVIYLKMNSIVTVTPIVKIYDRLGVLVSEMPVPELRSGFTRMDVSDLPEGLYLVEVSTTSQQISGKICIVR